MILHVKMCRQLFYQFSVNNVNRKKMIKFEILAKNRNFVRKLKIRQKIENSATIQILANNNKNPNFGKIIEHWQKSNFWQKH